MVIGFRVNFRVELLTAAAPFWTGLVARERERERERE